MNNPYRLSIGLATKDKSHLEKFKSSINTNKPIYDIEYYDDREGFKGMRYNSSIVISSKDYFDDLSYFNIVPRKSLSLEFPKHIKDHPLIQHFIRGYFDGDGSVGTRDRGTNIQLHFNMVGTENFLKDCSIILNNQCGLGRPNVTIHKRKKFDKNGIERTCHLYALQHEGNVICPKIYNYLYRDATVYLDRKFEIVRPYLSEETLKSIKAASVGKPALTNLHG